MNDSLWSDLDYFLSQSILGHFSFQDKIINITSYRQFKAFAETHVSKFIWDIIEVKEVIKQYDKVTALTLVLKKDTHSIECRLWLPDEVAEYLQDVEEYFSVKELKEDDQRYEAEVELRALKEEETNQ